MATCADILTRARYTLQDPEADSTGPIVPRASNNELMSYLNDGIAETYSLRPDLAIALLGAPFTPLAIVDSFPLPIQHEAVLIGYVVFRTEIKDDEAVNNGRAGSFRALFKEQVTSI